MSFSFSQSDEKELQPKPKTEAVEAAPREVVKPKKKTSKPVKTAKPAQTETRSNQVKFYITDSQLERFNELRGAVPASAFLFEKFQEFLK